MQCVAKSTAMSSFQKDEGGHDLLEKVQLCLPSFHAYGHKPQCQVCMLIVGYFL